MITAENFLSSNNYSQGPPPLKANCLVSLAPQPQACRTRLFRLCSWCCAQQPTCTFFSFQVIITRRGRIFASSLQRARRFMREKQPRLHVCSTAAGCQANYLHQAVHAQLDNGSAGIHLPAVSVICLAAISAPTTLTTSTAPPVPSTSWPAAFAWRSCPTAPQAAPTETI